jgi:hypothetical protein
VQHAFSNPIGLPRIRDLGKPGGRALIAFDDPTVPSFGPVRRLAIEAALSELAAGGVPEENVSLVCANALHRKWTPDELGRIIGDDLVRRFGDRLTSHDAEDPENIVHVGTTQKHGYPVDIHRAVVDSDLTIYINAQCQRGFGGGWKSVAVGLSTWRSISATHTPDGMSMSVRNNRMHNVFNEQGEFLEATTGKRIFKFETILSDATKIAHCWAGSVAATRAAALEVLEQRHPPRRSEGEPADVVVYGVPAWSPYATFAKMNPILTLISSAMGYMGGYIEALGKPGCSVIITTPCPEEWDHQHHAPYPEVWDRVLPETTDPYEISDLFGEEFATHGRYVDLYRNEYAFHPVHAILATHPLKRLKHAGRVFVAGAQDASVPKRVGFIPVPTVEAAIAEAETIHGKDCSIVCIEQALG